MQSTLNQSPRLLASVQRVSSSSLSSGPSVPLLSLKYSSSSTSSYSTSSVARPTLAASRLSVAPRSPVVTTTTLFQQVSSTSNTTTATAAALRLPLLRRAFSTQVPSQDQKYATSPATTTTPVANDTIESLLSKSLHDQGSEAAKKEKKAEPGPLDGIRVLDLTRVLGMSLSVWLLFFFYSCVVSSFEFSDRLRKIFFSGGTAAHFFFYFFFFCVRLHIGVLRKLTQRDHIALSCWVT